jgi:hypothetical protein
MRTNHSTLSDIATADENEGTTIFMAGDTNMNVFDVKTAQFVSDRGEEMGLTQLVAESTYREACIDHVVVTAGRQVSNVCLLHPIDGAPHFGAPRRAHPTLASTSTSRRHD